MFLFFLSFAVMVMIMMLLSLTLLGWVLACAALLRIQKGFATDK